MDIAFVKDGDKNNFPFLQATRCSLFGRTTNPQQEKGPHINFYRGKEKDRILRTT